MRSAEAIRRRLQLHNPPLSHQPPETPNHRLGGSDLDVERPEREQSLTMSEDGRRQIFEIGSETKTRRFKEYPEDLQLGLSLPAGS
jgi:hypothetical protein